MELDPGDIVSVDFPFSDGTETKRRPALVLSGKAIEHTGDILLMQITSKTKNQLNVLLTGADLTVPLPLKSFLRLHKVFTLDRSLVIKKISHLNEEKFRQVVSALFELLK